MRGTIAETQHLCPPYLLRASPLPPYPHPPSQTLRLAASTSRPPASTPYGAPFISLKYSSASLAGRMLLNANILATKLLLFSNSLVRIRWHRTSTIKSEVTCRLWAGGCDTAIECLLYLYLLTPSGALYVPVCQAGASFVFHTSYIGLYAFSSQQRWPPPPSPLPLYGGHLTRKLNEY